MAFLGLTKDNKEFNLDLNSLVTHGIVIGKSGSGKTSCLINLVEEATVGGVNSIILDCKGDLCTLLIPFQYIKENLIQWVEEGKPVVDEYRNWNEAQKEFKVHQIMFENAAEFKVIAPNSVIDSIPDINTLYSLTAESKPKVTVFYLRHLPDDHQQIFITNLLEKIREWLKTSKSSSFLKNLLVIDEAANILPPAPKSPLTKMPLAAIIAQARSQGLGVLLATQNPNDIDYKALSNVGTWFLGGLRKRDMQRDLKVIVEDKELESEDIYNLPPRNFIALTKDGKATPFRSRCTMSYLAGPIPLDQIEKLNALHIKETVISDTANIKFNMDTIPQSGYLASLEFKLENGSWITCRNALNEDLFFMINKGANTFVWDTKKQGAINGYVDIRLNIINRSYVPILNNVKVNSTGIA